MVFLPHYLSPRSRKASYSHMLLQCVTSSAPRCPSKLYGIARAAAGPNGLPQFSCWISKFPRRAQQFLGADPLKRKRKSPAGAPPAAGGGRAIAQYLLTVVVIQAQLPPRDWLLATLGVVWPKEPRRCQDMSKTKSAAAEGDGLYWRFLWTSSPHETSFPGCRKNWREANSALVCVTSRRCWKNAKTSVCSSCLSLELASEALITSCWPGKS